MTKRQLIILLDDPAVDSIRFVAGCVDSRRLSEGNTTVMATVTRMGTFDHPEYGRFSITPKHLSEFVRNFNERTYGQEIFVDRDHNPKEGAVAVVKRLLIEGNKLRAELEFTPFGIELATQKGYRYLSADYVEDYVHPETGEHKGPLLRGAAFTIRPFVKNLDPVQVQLSETGGFKTITLLDDKVIRLLNEENQLMWKQLREALLAKLRGFNLAEPAITKILIAADAAAAKVGENETSLKALSEQVETNGKILAETISEQSANAGRTLSEADVAALVKKQLQETQDAATKKLAEDKVAKDAKIKILTDTINAAQGLPEADKKQLTESLKDLISPAMTDDQVKSLAETVIRQAQQTQAARQLSSMGYRPGQQGNVHITVDDSNSIKQLQETTDKRLGILDMNPAKRFEKTGGTLQDENKKLAEKVLAMYDAEHAHQLRHEAKLLAGGDGLVADVAVPATFERTVIREALYQLTGLQFVDVGTEIFATSHYIPYSYRDTTAASLTSTRKYQGQSIARAGVIQTGDNVYPIPQKLAFEVSDELRYLTSNGQLQWDAVTENQRNASRIVGEDLEQLLFNEQLNAADEYGAVAVTGENLELQADDTKKVFILAQFPVVRPRIVRDHAGTQVGSTVNPITVTYNSVARLEYDGTGTQAAGTYYVLNYNLGEIYLVNEAGAIQLPANGTAYSISYSYATNVAKFDSDLGSDAIDDHWDKFLTTLGTRKSVIEDTRFHTANFGLMSGTLENTVGQAKKFAANYRRPGTELSTDGNIGRIKDVAHFKTRAPGLNMGDQRTIMGERGVTRFRMTKPWMMGELQDQKDSNGRFTGKKEAYGDQFIIVHTPTPLKRALTSTVVYSATARVARVAP
jgi:hypothetical protein